MSSDSTHASSVKPVIPDDAGPHPVWSEHMATMVATSLAVLIVAVIAVLMGMA